MTPDDNPFAPPAGKPTQVRSQTTRSPDWIAADAVGGVFWLLCGLSCLSCLAYEFVNDGLQEHSISCFLIGGVLMTWGGVSLLRRARRSSHAAARNGVSEPINS